MLESFAAWILNTYIGDYFGNVNTHQLRMSLKNGEIELEHLPLKRDIIRYLGLSLPLEASTGFIGKISMKFPSWSAFTSESLVITIEDLYLIVKPIKNFSYNEEEENRQQQEYKLSQLDIMEQRWKALHDNDFDNDQSSYYSSSYLSWLNYGSSFINNILINIHLKISSIHIRYEDCTTIPQCSFACGIIIKSLTICSTDENWKQKFVQSSTSKNNNDDQFLFKLIDLESFSCYLDTDTLMLSESNDLDEMVRLMRHTMMKNLNQTSTLNQQELEHDYIIAPVNGKCYMKRNCSDISLKSCRQPRTVIDVQLESVPIMMTAIQYKHLFDWSMAFQTQKTLWRYRKWRPMIDQHSKRDNHQDAQIDDNPMIRTEFHAKTWWHFAVNANLEEYRKRRQRFNWYFILKRCKDIIEYHRAYLTYLLWPESFSRDLRCIKDRIENELTLDELCSIRECIFYHANQTLIKQQQQQQRHRHSVTNHSVNDQINQDKCKDDDRSIENASEEATGSNSYWFLPINILSNVFYNNYSNTPSVDDQKSPDIDDDVGHDQPNNQSCTDDIFLTRDAVYCQFNFQIHNSSFQLMAFNSLTNIVQQSDNIDEVDGLGMDKTLEQDEDHMDELKKTSHGKHRRQTNENQGNLILEFEFNQMKIGVDITNPNAYACDCHNRDNADDGGGKNKSTNNPTLSIATNNNEKFMKKFLTQNELNQLQLDLNFECQNLNLTLLRTNDEDDAYTGDNDHSKIDIEISRNYLMEKLLTAQFNGCGWKFAFNNDSICIDGQMNSLELYDLITAAKQVNHHRRVLSIGKINDDYSSIVDTDCNLKPNEKALIFSLVKQMNENQLRLNVEMATFTYVHSTILVYELSLCRKCFSDVLEQYFSRTFKEQLKQATTEVFRGIVSDSGVNLSNDGGKDPNTVSDEQSNTKMLVPLSMNSLNHRQQINKSKSIKFKSNKLKTKSSRSKTTINPFVDNLKLNIFIHSPLIVFPITPGSYEVVVFHLGHMLLNNHNHSTDVIQKLNTNQMLSGPQRRRKFGTVSFDNPKINPPKFDTPASTKIRSTTNNSYNAEIRDLSIYSLDCMKNVEKYSSPNPRDLKAAQISVEKLYNCDLFGVPILQKTVIEIVLERKILFSSMNESVPNPASTANTAAMKKSSAPTAAVSDIVDGLNLISSVNSIDPLILPKKFSIRQHLYPDYHHQPNQSNESNMTHKKNPVRTSLSPTPSPAPAATIAKPEMVLSIEISTIDVRFSYTDLLVFWHIFNSLSMIDEQLSNDSKSTTAQMDANSKSTSAKNDPNDFDDELIMDIIQQLSLTNPDMNVDEFRSRLNNLIDLGFNPRDSLHALAIKNGDIIEAAYILSNQSNSDQQGTADQQQQQQRSNSDTDNQSQDNVSEISAATATTNTDIPSNLDNSDSKISKRTKSKLKSRANSNLLLSLLSVIEIKISNGSIRIIDDCNQLDLPLLELGIQDLRLMQYYTKSIEAHARTNFYCNYYNSHLSGWEPFIEYCQIEFSWKYYEPRFHLKSMLNISTISNRIQIAKKKLAIKIEIGKIFNLNISRQLLDLFDKVNNEWRNDIEQFMRLPYDQRTFRQRAPFIPFAIENNTGNDLHCYLWNANKMFSTGKAADLITPCDLKSILNVRSDRIVYFDCVDSTGGGDNCRTMLESKNSTLKNHRRQNSESIRSSTLETSSTSTTIMPLKIYVKIDGWQETFPLSIEREGTFIRHIVSERYRNQSAILVFEISLQATAIKLIKVRSSLLITNRTTKIVELKFVNTAMSDVRTSYLLDPKGIFPVPLDLLYARIQLRPYDSAIGTCSTYINWNHVKKFGELDCSLQICTPITQTKHGSYTKLPPYIVSVLIERNSIGALIESKNIFKQHQQVMNSFHKQQQHQSYNDSVMNDSFTSTTSIPKLSSLITLPSHMITLLPPIQLSNRLPYDVRFRIINDHHNNHSTNNGINDYNYNSNQSKSSHHHQHQQQYGTIRSGDDYSIHHISPLEAFSLEIQMEQYPKCRPLLIQPGAIKNIETYLEMYDARNRLLLLNVSINIQLGCPQPSNAMTIIIYSSYWIINRSGLPLIFAQDNNHYNNNLIEEAAGQYDEHERARSLLPLLFNFSNQDTSTHYCIMRLGKMLPNMMPRWCNLFCLEKGTFYRRLRVTEYSSSSSDNNSSVPIEKIYEFGIDIRQGRDRYNQTKIVTIAPRFQIENLTSFKLEFAQKCFVQNQLDNIHLLQSSYDQAIYSDDNFTSTPLSSPMKSRRDSSTSYNNRSKATNSEKLQIISALPKSNLPFHWPASDQPKLLCVRIASIIGCQWSGCFDVGSEISVSFQLNIRDDCGHSNFIRVEILLQNATYFIVFTDANNLPPPIRVENFSQVAIEFYQAECLHHRTIVRPNSSVPYALDEPTKQAKLIICAPGGSSSTYDLNTFQSNTTLTYDNFYYLAFEETFTSFNNIGSYFNSGSGANIIGDDDDDFEQLMYMMLSANGSSLNNGNMMSTNDPENSNEYTTKMLVLDVPDYDYGYHNQPQQPLQINENSSDKPKPVYLYRKERAKRTQLWRMDQLNHLINEGSSPPIEPPGYEDLGFAEIKYSSSTNNTANKSSKHRQQQQTLMVLDVMDDEIIDLNLNQQQSSVISIPLAVRKLNPLRASSQTWYFTEDGRLRCLKYWNMFVQPLVSPTATSLNDIFQSGVMAVISYGPTNESVTKSTIPKQQAIVKQKMRKGSGVLNVSILADGPSRVLRIKDNQLTANGRQLNLIQLRQPKSYHYYNDDQHHQQQQEHLNDLLSNHPDTNQNNDSFLMRLLNRTELELQLQVNSIGLSIISKTNEEIIFLYLKKIILELLCNPIECRLNCIVEDFQVDNQLLNSEKEVVLYVTNLQPQTSSTNDNNHNNSNNNTDLTANDQPCRSISLTAESSPNNRNNLMALSDHHHHNHHSRKPALTFNMHKLFIPNVEINVFKNFQININDLVLNIEEMVLLKLLEFIQYNPVDSEMDEISSSSSSSSSSAAVIAAAAAAGTTTTAASSTSLLYHTANSNVVSSSLSRSAQYFFAVLLIQLKRIKLSVFTSSAKLSRYLTDLKKKAGIKLIRFEEALIQLKSYHKLYSLMTKRFIQDSIHEHYRNELRGQAAKILGTVDFLGNPVGFINNVVESLNEFYSDGSIRGLIMNVTHGISDSTAKVTSALSESLGFVTMDDRHQEIRRKIKQQTGGIGAQRSHLLVGAFGLAHGLLGGFTSVITQTYDGIVNHGGITGFLSGLSKGVLGTFTKPAVGMLDFASGAATAARDSSRKICYGMNGRQVRRIRLPRTLTIDGRLTRYQSQQSQWQSRFYNTNDFGSKHEYDEQFVHVFTLSDRHFLLLSTECLYFFHAPIRKCQLPSEDIWDNHTKSNNNNYVDDDYDEFLNQQNLILTNCPIQQLKILSLDSFIECNHHRMMLKDGEYFLKHQSHCKDLTSMIGTSFEITDENHNHSNSNEKKTIIICNFIEFRQTSSSPSSFNNNSHRMFNNDNKLNFEYPTNLNPCYLYCDSSQTVQNMIQLINEAKHLQEERKFEVSNLDL